MYQLLRNTYVWLFLIFLLGATVRFIHIDQIPVSLYWDETAIGYNAYSILHTGKDEYGAVMPVLFRSFNDYKLGGYIYLTVIPVLLFGLSEVAVRFWSAFFGSISVFLMYLFALQVLSFTKVPEKSHRFVALIASLLLAISPWLINFSRVGFEANVGACVIVGSISIFLYYLRSQKIRWYLVSTLLCVASIYFYRSEWVFVPMIFLFAHLLFWREIHKKIVLLYAFVIFLVLSLPLVIAVRSESLSDRSLQVTFLQQDVDKLNYDLAQNRLKFKMVGGDIIFNRRLLRVYQLGQNYVSNLSPQYLFISGDPEIRHGARGLGVLYWIDEPLLLAGLWFLLTQRSKGCWLLLGWVLLAIIPAAIALPNPHALRSLPAAWGYLMSIALGIWWVSERFTKRTWIVLGLIGIGYLGCFLFFLYQYFVVTPPLAAYNFGDGYKQLHAYLQSQKGYDKFIISGEYWKPYIYFLFYDRYDPSLYQKTGSESGYGKYLFGPTGWDQVDAKMAGLSNVNLSSYAGTNKVLVALSPKEYHFQREKYGVSDAIHVIYNHAGYPMFYIARPW